MISFPFASKRRSASGGAPSSPSSPSCIAVFMSAASEMRPMSGAKRSPPNIAPNISSGSTKPPSGALSRGPNSLYLRRSAGSASVWYATATSFGVGQQERETGMTDMP
jgi:hypothetical protein